MLELQMEFLNRPLIPLRLNAPEDCDYYERDWCTQTHIVTRTLKHVCEPSESPSADTCDGMHRAPGWLALSSLGLAEHRTLLCLLKIAQKPLFL